LKIFVSWSGEKSRTVAEALREWVPNVFATLVNPWVSSRDIATGERSMWNLADELKDTRVGVVCLTRTNLESRWIHFEAGAISNAVEKSYLCTYLIDVEVSDVQQPLAQFQSAKADREGTRRLVTTINAALGPSGFTTDRLTTVFDVWWQQLQPKLVDLPDDNVGRRVSTRTEREVLEELVMLVRNQANPPYDNPMLSALREMRGKVDRLLEASGTKAWIGEETGPGYMHSGTHNPAGHTHEARTRQSGYAALNSELERLEFVLANEPATHDKVVDEKALRERVKVVRQMINAMFRP
jgi:hypothetical protein